MNWKANSIKRKCRVCGKTFFVKKRKTTCPNSQIFRPMNSQTCSRKCSILYRDNPKKYAKNKLI